MEEILKLLAQISEHLRQISDECAEITRRLKESPTSTQFAQNAPKVQESSSAVAPPETKKIQANRAEPKKKDLPQEVESKSEAKADIKVKKAPAIVSHLEAINREIMKENLEISPSDTAVLPKIIQVFNDLDQEEMQSEKGTKLFLDSLAFLDAFFCKYSYGVRCRDFHNAVQAARNEAISRLHARGHSIFPDTDAKTLDDALRQTGAIEGALQHKEMFSSRAKGEILEVRRHGVALSTTVIRSAQVIVSAGVTSPVSELLASLHQLVCDLRAESQAAKEAKLRALDSLLGWEEKLFGALPEYLLTVARYALNLIYSLKDAPLDRLFHGQTAALERIASRLTDLLKKSGLSEVIVSIGSLFDESYDPGKYERRRVPGKKSPGVITAVIRPGFLDKNGVPVQKAIVAVSSG